MRVLSTHTTVGACLCIHECRCIICSCASTQVCVRICIHACLPACKCAAAHTCSRVTTHVFTNLHTNIHVPAQVSVEKTPKPTSRAAMATRQARGFPPKVDPCSPGRMVNMTSSSASTADTCIIKHSIHMTPASSSTASTWHLHHQTQHPHDTCIIKHNIHLTPASSSTASTWHLHHQAQRPHGWINGVLSITCIIYNCASCGKAQGTVLAPFLFSLHTVDCRALMSHVLLWNLQIIQKW